MSLLRGPSSTTGELFLVFFILLQDFIIFKIEQCCHFIFNRDIIQPQIETVRIIYAPAAVCVEHCVIPYVHYRKTPSTSQVQLQSYTNV